MIIGLRFPSTTSTKGHLSIHPFKLGLLNKMWEWCLTQVQLYPGWAPNIAIMDAQRTRGSSRLPRVAPSSSFRTRASLWTTTSVLYQVAPRRTNSVLPTTTIKIRNASTFLSFCWWTGSTISIRYMAQGCLVFRLRIKELVLRCLCPSCTTRERFPRTCSLFLSKALQNGVQ